MILKLREVPMMIGIGLVAGFGLATLLPSKSQTDIRGTRGGATASRGNSERAKAAATIGTRLPANVGSQPPASGETTSDGQLRQQTPSSSDNEAEIDSFIRRRLSEGVTNHDLAALSSLTPSGRDYEKQLARVEGPSGARYQYDLNNPSDRMRYDLDTAAQLRDSSSIDQRRQNDVSLGYHGGGIVP